MPKVFVYLRVSTDDKGQDPRNQERQCLDLIKVQNLGEDIEVFTEEKSAWQSYNRPVFDSMIKRAIKEGIKDIAVWDLDRVYRDRVKMVSLMKELNRTGIKIRSVRQAWLEEIHRIPSPWNEIIYDLLINIIGWMAEEESTKKSQRVKAAYEHKKKKAETKGQRLRWGRPELEVDIDKVLQLREEGKSIRDIAEVMNVSVGSVHKIIREKTPQISAV
jgi:DNA invertase Pin-like site-specific DNA recombinase